MAKNVMARIIPSFAKPPNRGYTKIQALSPAERTAATAGQASCKPHRVIVKIFHARLAYTHFVAPVWSTVMFQYWLH